MREYNFVLVLDGFHELSTVVEDRLFEAGCSDALLGLRGTTPFLDFDREAETAEGALVSAIRDVRAAGYDVVAIEPGDLVSLSEIAERLGRTRQSAHQLITGTRGPGGFPAPAQGYGERTRLWRWTEVLEWVEREVAHLPEPRAPGIELARAIATVNGALTMGRYLGKEGRARLVSSLERAS